MRKRSSDEQAVGARQSDAQTTRAPWARSRSGQRRSTTFRRGGVFVAGLALLALLQVNAAAADGSVGAAASSAGVTGSAELAQVQAATSFRQLAGFNDDPAFVQSLVTAQTRGDSTVENVMGMPMTHSEAVELRNRLALQAQVHLIVDYGVQNPGYAGMYIDQHAGGIAVALFTGDLSRPVEALKTFPMPERLRIASARWSLTELQATADAVNRSADALAAQGIHVTIAGVDVATNSVRVGVETLTTAAQTYFDAQYQGRVTTVQQDPGTELAAINGGSEIHNQTHPAYCTAGFSYRAGDGGTGFFTAGHCGNGADTWNSVQYPNQVYKAFNCIEGGATFPSRGSDSCTIPAGEADTTNVSGWVNVTRAAALSEDQVGMFICDYGSFTATQKCGTISRLNIAFTASGIHGTTTTYDTREMDMGCNGSQSGDSGGPVYNGPSNAGVAFGLLRGAANAGCTNNHVYYTHVRYAMQYWGVTVPK